MIKTVKSLRLLSLLTVLGASPASALYCASPVPDDTRLAAVTRIVSTSLSSSKLLTQEETTYQGGRPLESVTSLSGASMPATTWAATWHYAADGQLSTLDTVAGFGSSKPVPSQEKYEYDAQGRVSRVLFRERGNREFVTLATCSYRPGTVTEHETGAQGYQPRTFEYTLDGTGQVTRYSQTIQGNEGDTNVTTIIREGGRVVRAEQHVVSSMYGSQITVTDYNADGMPVASVSHTYESEQDAVGELTMAFKMEYLLDTRGNWTQKLEYVSEGGPWELSTRETRTITYTAP